MFHGWLARSCGSSGSAEELPPADGDVQQLPPWGCCTCETLLTGPTGHRCGYFWFAEASRSLVFYLRWTQGRCYLEESVLFMQHGFVLVIQHVWWMVCS